MMVKSLGPIELLLVLVAVFGAGVPFWKIFSKAGYPGVMGLALFVPVLNVVMLWFLGLSEWPVHKELNALRQRLPPSIPM